jgi:hypothetical protein
MDTGNASEGQKETQFVGINGEVR